MDNPYAAPVGARDPLRPPPWHSAPGLKTDFRCLLGWLRAHWPRLLFLSLVASAPLPAAFHVADLLTYRILPGYLWILCVLVSTLPAGLLSIHAVMGSTSSAHPRVWETLLFAAKQLPGLAKVLLRRQAQVTLGLAVFWLPGQLLGARLLGATSVHLLGLAPAPRTSSLVLSTTAWLSRGQLRGRWLGLTLCQVGIASAVSCELSWMLFVRETDTPLLLDWVGFILLGTARYFVCMWIPLLGLARTLSSAHARGWPTTPPWVESSSPRSTES